MYTADSFSRLTYVLLNWGFGYRGKHKFSVWTRGLICLIHSINSHTRWMTKATVDIPTNDKKDANCFIECKSCKTEYCSCWYLCLLSLPTALAFEIETKRESDWQKYDKDPQGFYETNIYACEILSKYLSVFFS